MVRAVLLGPGGCMRLPSAEDILPPIVEGCSEPNAHPRINRTVTKYTSAVLTWVHTKIGTILSLSDMHSLGSPTIAHSRYLRE